ncbi:MAG: DUF3098 domain-containing protein [Saprospiraceae bacterium]|nr:DUF3098 domain-containing protein [Saprospiraceae bacterium]
MNKKTKNIPAVKQKKTETTHVDFTFGKKSYTLLLIGLAFITLGFILMVGGGSPDPNEFNPEIFNFQRITLAPILILIGYVIEIFAIMKKPKDATE